jgi:hypothetical protein
MTSITLPTFVGKIDRGINSKGPSSYTTCFRNTNVTSSIVKKILSQQKNSQFFSEEKKSFSQKKSNGNLDSAMSYSRE